MELAPKARYTNDEPRNCTKQKLKMQCLKLRKLQLELELGGKIPVICKIFRTNLNRLTPAVVPAMLIASDKLIAFV